MHAAAGGIGLGDGKLHSALKAPAAAEEAASKLEQRIIKLYPKASSMPLEPAYV